MEFGAVSILFKEIRSFSTDCAPATKGYITRTVTVLVIFCCLKIGCNNALKWHYYVKLGKNWVK
nr:MAG TPA_asm: hypothetical protein [Caudoviricetes sp.]